MEILVHTLRGIAIIALAVSFFAGIISKQAATKSTCTSAQWEAQYFTNIDLNDKPALVRCEDGPPNYRWNGASPAPEIPGNFSARWSGGYTQPKL
jgi:hypothetical protein